MNEWIWPRDEGDQDKILQEVVQPFVNRESIEIIKYCFFL